MKPNPRRLFLWRTYSVAGFVACCHCEKNLTFREMTVEHLLPRALGGSNDKWNILPSCKPCNNERPCEDIRIHFVDFLNAKFRTKKRPKIKPVQQPLAPVAALQKVTRYNSLIFAHAKSDLPTKMERIKAAEAKRRKERREKKKSSPNIWHIPNPAFSFAF